MKYSEFTATTITMTTTPSEVAATTTIQLGFSVPITSKEQLERVAHRSPDYSVWDGGQMGGRPVWLQPKHVPDASSVQCRHCQQEPMRFVCQLYAPVEDLKDGDDNRCRAFHRTLYVFACPFCVKETTGAVRVFRTQLPKENPFYPTPDLTEDSLSVNNNTRNNWKNHKPESWNVHLCVVCGLQAKGKCPIQQEYFCCKEHQKEYKRCVFDRVRGGLDALPLASVYPLSELVVEEEPPLPSNKLQEEPTSATTALFQHDDDDDNDSDLQLEQDDLNAMTGANNKSSSRVSQDPVTMAFYSRLRDRPDVKEQCLRYNCRFHHATITARKDSKSDDDNDDDDNDDDQPLWISSSHQPTTTTTTTTTEFPPPCEVCHSPRRFEFQLMPQMLHYLLKGRGGNGGGTNTAKAKAAMTRTTYETIKEAVQTADSLVRQAPPEQIPPALVEAKESAVQRVQEGLTNNHHHDDELDWGVVAVYTCRNCCCDDDDHDDDDQGKTTSPELGAYREEFAWRQPSLDAIV